MRPGGTVRGLTGSVSACARRGPRPTPARRIRRPLPPDPNTRNRSKDLREPAVVRDRQDGALERGRWRAQAPRPSAGPGCRSARRAAAGSPPKARSSRIWKRACWPPDERFVPLLGLAGEPVAVQRAGGRFAAEPGAVLIAAVQDLQQRAALQVRPGCGSARRSRDGSARPAWRCRRAPPAAIAMSDDRQVLAVRVGAAGGAAAAGSGTCRSRWNRARRRGRRTRSRWRTASSARSAPGLRRTTARLAVRPPLSRICTFCSIGSASGGPGPRGTSPAGSAAAWYRFAMSERNAALFLYMLTSSLSFTCSSSQRFRSSSKRAFRSARAST